MKPHAAKFRSLPVGLLDDVRVIRLNAAARHVLVTLRLRFGPTGIEAHYPDALIANLVGWTALDRDAVVQAMTALEGADPPLVRRERNIVWIVDQLPDDPYLSSENVNHRKRVVAEFKALPRLAIVRAFYAANVAYLRDAGIDIDQYPTTPEGPAFSPYARPGRDGTPPPTETPAESHAAGDGESHAAGDQVSHTRTPGGSYDNENSNEDSNSNGVEERRIDFVGLLQPRQRAWVDQFEPQDRQAIAEVIRMHRKERHWRGEVDGIVQGMSDKPIDRPTVGRAIRECLANGKEPTMWRIRNYVRGLRTEADTTAPAGGAKRDTWGEDGGTDAG